MSPSLVALLVSVALPGAVGSRPSASGEGYLAELVGKARRLRLADDPAWLRLGHWRPRALGGFESEADGRAFFLAPRGKTDPRGELEATLRGFLDDRAVADELDDARCRFPARLAYLASRLGFDPARLPRRPCPRYEEHVSRLAARSATLVFSSYYLATPASAFGHTFLRLNRGEGAREGKAHELLDWAINYSAVVDTKNAVLYAIRGLLGLFQGRFSQLAYYYKVREYSDAESRDLWEYDLALSPDEIAMLAAHLWELGGTYFDYFYLDENCSYHVLGALEAAAPRLELLRFVGRQVVVPADTVKALYRNPGLVRAVHYRPSIRTQFEARLRLLDGRGRDLVEALSADPRAPFPDGVADAGRAAALDAAVDLVDLRNSRALAVGQAPEAARARQVLLERRAAIPVRSPPLAILPPADRAPQVGHGSSRLGGGAGASSRDGAFAVLDLRVALHDLADPPDGYPPLGQLEFLPARLRFSPRRAPQVDEAWIVRTVWLGEASRFDRRPSWRLRAGAATVRDGACRSCLAAQAEFGAGVARGGILGPLDVYAGIDTAVEWSPRLDGTDGRPVRAGLGPGGIARLRLGKRATLLADARLRWLPAASPAWTHELRGTLRLHLVPGLSLWLEGQGAPRESAVSGGVLGYF